MTYSSKAALQFPHSGNLADDWRTADNFKALQYWADRMVNGTAGFCLPTTDPKCQMRIPHLSGPYTPAQIDENFAEVERWSVMWRQGTCCSGGTAEVCQFHYLSGRSLKDAFLDVEYWADLFLRNCCNCGGDGQCDVCSEFNFHLPAGLDSNTFGISLTQGSVGHNGRNVFAAYERFTVPTGYRIAKYTNNGNIDNANLFNGLGYTYADLPQFSGWGGDMCMVYHEVASTDCRLKTWDETGGVPSEITSWDSTSYSSYPSAFSVTFDGTYVWIFWPDATLRVTFSDGTKYDASGDTDANLIGNSSGSGEPPRVFALENGYLAWVYSGSGGISDSYWYPTVTGTGTLLREGTTDHFYWNESTQALTIRDSYSNGYAWWRFSYPYTSATAEEATWVGEEDCYMTDTSFNAGIPGDSAVNTVAVFDIPTWTIIYYDQTWSPCQLWWIPVSWSAAVPPGAPWVVRWGSNPNCWLFGYSPDPT